MAPLPSPAAHALGPLADCAEAPAAAGVYAIARVGAQHIAIANAAVSQAVACPERLVSLPRRVGALEGLFSLQGQWVPVVRLDHWVDIGPAPAVEATDRRIVILRQAGQVMGLLVDGVMGVRQVRAGELARVYRDERPDELFQSVIAADGAQPAASVLEARRLMTLAAAWCDTAEGEPPPAGDETAQGGRQAAEASPRSTCATFRIGDTWFAVPAAHIGELIPSPPLQSTMPTGSAARGICTWRGRFVPVVDLAGLLAPGPSADVAASVCIVRWGELAIGVLVHEVGGLRELDAARLQRRAGPDPAHDVLLGVMAMGDGQMLQMLDTARLMACFPETELSAPRGAPAPDRADGGPRSAEAFVVFSAGPLLATPAAPVQEVVSLPAALLTRLDAGQPATLAWRGLAVPVVDLRRSVSGAKDMRPTQLAIVADGERRAAVTISSVKELVPARTATRTRTSAGAGMQIDMVTVQGGGQQVSYTVLDLARFIAAAPGDAA